jgi:hypothetical protein
MPNHTHGGVWLLFQQTTACVVFKIIVSENLNHVFCLGHPFQRSSCSLQTRKTEPKSKEAKKQREEGGTKQAKRKSARAKNKKNKKAKNKEKKTRAKTKKREGAKSQDRPLPCYLNLKNRAPTDH